MWTSISLRPNAASSVARPEWRWRVSGRSTRIALAIRLSPYLRVHREALCRKRIRIDVTCRVVQRTISWNFTVSARHWARNLVCCRRVVARARARVQVRTRARTQTRPHARTAHAVVSTRAGCSANICVRSPAPRDLEECLGGNEVWCRHACVFL